MAHLVGTGVRIPGEQWDPKEDEPSVGTVTKHLNPTARYPSGRIEVTVTGSRKKMERYIWALDKFPQEWFTSAAGTSSHHAAAPSSTRATPASKARSSGHSSVAHVSGKGEAQNGQSSPSPPRRGRSKSTGRRKSTSGKTEAAAEAGPDSGGEGPTPAGLRSRRGRSRGAAVRQQQEPEAGPSVPVTPAAAAAAPPPPEPQSQPQPEDSAPAAKAHAVRRLSPRNNALNAALMVAVALPACVYGYAIAASWAAPGGPAPLSAQEAALAAGPWQPLSLSWWLAIGRHCPLLAANLVFLLNVDVLFWLISLAQKSTWLIDPYWTFIPPLVAFFFASHPLAKADPARSFVVLALVCVWSIRLTHSYLRREEWQFGAREDWRFGDASGRWARHWWWFSFFYAFLSQHLLLVGICWPFHTVFTVAAPWHPLWDTLAATAAVAGIAIAAVADTQLRAFMVGNEHRKLVGLEPVLINDTGLWRYSRHPNYFGEMLWWWGLAGFAIRLGQPWVAAGALFNTIIMYVVTQMVEAKMRAKPERAEAWERYCATTSVWVPWWPKVQKQA